MDGQLGKVTNVKSRQELVTHVVKVVMDEDDNKVFYVQIWGGGGGGCFMVIML